MGKQLKTRKIFEIEHIINNVSFLYLQTAKMLHLTKPYFMKKYFYFLTVTMLLSVCQSCWFFGPGDDPVVPVEQYDPVIVTRAELENVNLQAPKPTTKNAKIYIKDQYIFVNDSKKGFHIIDNSNPAQPQKIKYLQAIGSTDVAIRNNVLYVNQARDLVALQINPATNQLTVLKRITNVFPPLMAPNGQTADVSANQIVIDWKKKN